MSVELKVGEWYRCRDEVFRAHVVGPVTHAKYKFAAAVYCEGEFMLVLSFTADGRFYDNEAEVYVDIVEHLPDCTGPDWKPKKWRKATVHDAVNGRQCRVTLADSSFESNICGFKKDARYLYFYIMNPGQCKFWYDSDCVEVEE